jgi:transcriptional regulator with XRE-family HTH domain
VLEARGESAKSVSGDLAEGLVEVLIEKSISASDGSPKPILHRIAEVRAEQGVSLRSVSRRTGIEVRKLKQQEDPHYNLSLAELLVWQRALDVPLSDLLIDSTSKLSQPVQQRAQLVKIMKTVAAIAEVATTPRVSRMVMMLREQLLELMPELKEVSAWPNYGQRRAPNQVGKIGESPIITSQLGLDNNGD